MRIEGSKKPRLTVAGLHKDFKAFISWLSAVERVCDSEGFEVVIVLCSHGVASDTNEDVFPREFLEGVRAVEELARKKTKYYMTALMKVFDTNHVVVDDYNAYLSNVKEALCNVDEDVDEATLVEAQNLVNAVKVSKDEVEEAIRNFSLIFEAMVDKEGFSDLQKRTLVFIYFAMKLLRPGACSTLEVGRLRQSDVSVKVLSKATNIFLKHVECNDEIAFLFATMSLALTEKEAETVALLKTTADSPSRS